MGFTDDQTIPTVSLVVPVLNEAEHIGACLSALVRQTYPADHIEILVVDGTSTDETRDIVRGIAASDPRIRLLDSPARSTADGLNVGIAASTGAVVGYIHGRSRVQTTYVETGVAALRETGAWAVGGRIARIGRTPMQHAIAIATSSPIGIGDARHNYADAAGEVESVFPGLWPRWVFDRVGVFDPAMIRNEDNELSYRIRLAGGRIWLDPRIATWYEPRSDLGSLFTQYGLYGMGKAMVARKHSGALRLRTLVPAAWVTFLATAVPASVVAPRLRLPTVAGLGLYGAVVLIGALRCSTSLGEAFRVMSAFVTLHIAYGVGFLRGVASIVASDLFGRTR